MAKLILWLFVDITACVLLCSIFLGWIASAIVGTLIGLVIWFVFNKGPRSGVALFFEGVIELLDGLG